jgi:hypothetical protein
MPLRSSLGMRRTNSLMVFFRVVGDDEDQHARPRVGMYRGAKWRCGVLRIRPSRYIRPPSSRRTAAVAMINDAFDHLGFEPSIPVRLGELNWQEHSSLRTLKE